MVGRFGEVEDAPFGGDRADQALAHAQAGDVDRFLAEAVGREQLQRIVAQQIDRADLALHRLGDQVDHLVELGLRRPAPAITSWSPVRISRAEVAAVSGMAIALQIRHTKPNKTTQKKKHQKKNKKKKPPKKNTQTHTNRPQFQSYGNAGSGKQPQHTTHTTTKNKNTHPPPQKPTHKTKQTPIGCRASPLSAARSRRYHPPNNQQKKNKKHNQKKKNPPKTHPKNNSARNRKKKQKTTACRPSSRYLGGRLLPGSAKKKKNPPHTAT